VNEARCPKMLEGKSSYVMRSAALRVPKNMSAAHLILPRPDDWHIHLRDGENMQSLLQR
jgi:hypothetical protein